MFSRLKISGKLIMLFIWVLQELCQLFIADFSHLLFVVDFLASGFFFGCLLHFFRQLFITYFLAGCLLHIFSPVVYYRFSHQLFIADFLTDCLLYISHQLFIADFITGCLLQIFSLVVYCRFSSQLFIADFLTGCLLQIFSPVVYCIFLTSCLLQIFSPVVYYRFSHQLFITDFLTHCLLYICHWCNMLKPPPVISWHGSIFTSTKLPYPRALRAEALITSPLSLTLEPSIPAHHLPFYIFPLNEKDTSFGF